MIRPHLNPLPEGEEAGFAAGESQVFNAVPHLFAELVVRFDTSRRSAALNMAIDEALLEIANEPTIRFYRWDHPALSFGYFGKFADVAPHENQRDIVRRWTGGGIVFHGEDLTYSVIIPASDPAFAESSISIYERVHAAICKTLVACGYTSELATVAALYERRSEINSACFANPVRADVLVDGRKIAGAAQRRTRGGLLLQGSIQNVDLPEKFTEQLVAQLSQECRERSLDQGILERAQQIADQKYATAAWLCRR